MLRRLAADDLAALAALERQAASPPRSRGMLAQTLADIDTRVVGIEARGRLVGHAIVARLPFEAELQALLVAPDHRRRGLAGELLGAVIEQARRWQSERLLLEVRAGNGGAIALYRRAGFTEDGRRRGYYPPREAGEGREDAVLMSLPLDRR
ncbi:GNAT family N-acetyltransferase [Halomonas sp. EGI 63088]|uniref:GNAT family N-acetyltransferase n=1 Tax=Halomonas flagellata TaxID=2920385 RepID=A0ABS9RPX4_9GAMM|nr:GNAT family N-acetyltransferase [Halomonas flagellata]MCH4561885.1 GNAT family N-acetyltransferase [Halomonas flagellata]